MKHFILVSILLLSLKGYSQTSLKTEPGNYSSLEQYLWSYSKNSSKPGKKALIDFDAIENWQSLGGYLAVCNNGKYFAYAIDKPSGTRYWWRRLDSVVVQSTNKNWRIAFADARQGFFSADNKVYVFQKGDEMWLLQLGTAKIQIIKNPKDSLINNLKEAAENKAADNATTDNSRYEIISIPAPDEVVGKLTEGLASVEVWSHKDLYLQTAQAKQVGKTAKYNAIKNRETGEIVFRESRDKKLSLLKGDFAIVKKDDKEQYGDRFWETKENDSTWIISLNEEKSKAYYIPSDKYWFSPDSKWLVYFDNHKGCHYYSYELNTGLVKDITINVPEDQLGINNGDEHRQKFGNLAAWVHDEATVLVYDNYDIWKIDLTGKQPAVNITNAVGSSKNIILNLFTTDRYSSEIPTIKANDPLLLRAYNNDSKQSGFYKKDNIKSGTLTELYMGNHFFKSIDGCQDGNVTANGGVAPVKAKNANTWIVQRQSTNDAPNYYTTTDFKNFKRLTDHQPQENYQWFTEEIISFKYLDGKMGQGILYKPENFDPNKKYPVLIPFYGGFTGNMFQFPAPNFINQAMGTGMSPVWFLNNGYLVFTPDIAVAPRKYGPKAFSVIEGAAQYLKTLPYVDGNKLGVGSHSWSAKLGAYIFTHSTSMSATAISEGFLYGDMIDVAFSSTAEGKSKMEEVENGFEFGNVWDNKESWLEHTTVLNVDKSVSPLLLLCNKESSTEYQDQTLQFFTALRRLDKKAWWLKYDNGDHVLRDLTELKDYTIRYTQFFDHYLKNAPAPQWMTQGIPYKLKGIESRYELDPQGACNSANGEPCLICQAWNAQYKKTPEMFQKEIKHWVLDKDIADDLERKQNERRKELDKEGAVRTAEVMRMLKK